MLEDDVTHSHIQRTLKMQTSSKFMLLRSVFLSHTLSSSFLAALTVLQTAGPRCAPLLMGGQSIHQSLCFVCSVNNTSVNTSIYSLMTASLQEARLPKMLLSVNRQAHFHCNSFYWSSCKAIGICSNTSTMSSFPRVPLSLASFIHP